MLLRAGRARRPLLTCVRQGMRVGVESYGLKHVEQLTGFARVGRRGSRRPTPCSPTTRGMRRAATRRSSTASPATTRRTAARRSLCATGSSASGPRTCRRRPSRRCASAARSGRARGAARRGAARRSLTDGEDAGSARWLAGELLEYHRREARPGWWRWFALRQMDDEELCADAEAIGQLTPSGEPREPATGSVGAHAHVPAAEPQARAEATTSTIPTTGAGRARSTTSTTTSSTIVIRAQAVRGRGRLAARR